MNYYFKVLKNYVGFEGRARRKEFWIFTLVNMIIILALSAIAVSLDMLFISIVYSLAILLPTIAVTIRRLHDIGKPGSSILVVFIPVLGLIWLFFKMCTDGIREDNAYGEATK